MDKEITSFKIIRKTFDEWSFKFVELKVLKQIGKQLSSFNPEVFSNDVACPWSLICKRKILARQSEDHDDKVNCLVGL